MPFFGSLLSGGYPIDREPPGSRATHRLRCVRLLSMNRTASEGTIAPLAWTYMAYIEAAAGWLYHGRRGMGNLSFFGLSEESLNLLALFSSDSTGLGSTSVSSDNSVGYRSTRPMVRYSPRAARTRWSWVIDVSSAAARNAAESTALRMFAPVMSG